MRKIAIIIIMVLAGIMAKAQSPSMTIDSLERYINRYIRNSAVEAFTNLRMNTVLINLARYADSAIGAGTLDTAYRAGDSLKIVTNLKTFTVFIGGVGGGNPNLSVTTTSTTVNVNIDGTGTDATLPAATTSQAGVMTGAMKSKLDSSATHRLWANDSIIIYYNSLGIEKWRDTLKALVALNSIEGSGNAIQLKGDQASPGANKVYGTDGSGVLGYKPDPAGGGASLSGTDDYLLKKTGAATAATMAARDSAGNIVTSNGVYSKSFDKGGAVYNVQAYGIFPDGTDQTAKIQGLLNYMQTLEGGEIFFPVGKYRIDGQILWPKTAIAVPLSKSWKMTGGGAFAGSGPTDNSPRGGTIFDLRGSFQTGSFNFRGVGKVAIRGITFDMANAADSATALFTTSTVLDVSGCGFFGSGVHESANDNAIVLGGTNPLPIDSTNNSAFQGYGTTISDNWFNRIRRGVWGKTYANAIRVDANTWWYECGSDSLGAAIVFEGIASNSDVGNVVSNNLFEMHGYKYAQIYRYSNGIRSHANSYYDEDAGTAACIKLGLSSQSLFVDEAYISAIPLLYDSAGADANIILDATPGITNKLYNKVIFKTGADFYSIGPNIIRPTTLEKWYMKQYSQDQISLAFVPNGGGEEGIYTIWRTGATGRRLTLNGTGNNDVWSDGELRLASNDGGTIWLGSKGVLNTYATSGGQWNFKHTATTLKLTNTGTIDWSGTGLPSGGTEVAIGRNAAGVLEVNNGTLGTFRDLIIRNVRITGGTPGSNKVLISDGSGNGSWGDNVGSANTVPNGKTGFASTTAYGIIAGGTTSTGTFQNIGTGTAGQRLKSNGSAALPTWVDTIPMTDFTEGTTSSLTFTYVTNTSTTSSVELAYYRSGNNITFYGTVTVVPTASGAWQLDMAFPIASAITSAYMVAGTGACNAFPTELMEISGDGTNDRFVMKGNASNTTTRTYYIHGSYRYIAP